MTSIKLLHVSAPKMALRFDTYNEIYFDLHLIVVYWVYLLVGVLNVRIRTTWLT